MVVHETSNATHVNGHPYACVALLVTSFMGIRQIPHAHNTCNMGMGDLPDMYAQSSRAACMLKAQGLRAYILGNSRMAMLQVLRITLFP